MAFTVALAQTAPKKADVAHNIAQIAELCMQASGEGAELAVFAEGAVTGYFLEGGVLEAAMSGQELLDALCSRLTLARPLDALVGFYESWEGNLHNSAAYLELGPGGGRVVHVYRKFFLPTYGVFDEERFVSRGTELGVFETRLGKVGVLICEDVWHSLMPTLCALKGAQLLLIPSASPARGFSDGRPENRDRYERMLRAVSEEHGVWCANAHLCGFEGGKGFIGGSFVVSPFGKVVAESPIQEEHLLLAEVDLDLVEIARAQTPLISDLRGSWPAICRLVEGI
jgi:predicted amidohydrolase